MSGAVIRDTLVCVSSGDITDPRRREVRNVAVLGVCRNTVVRGAVGVASETMVN
jgi:hypothetical protein